jgi:hypothetical protein
MPSEEQDARNAERMQQQADDTDGAESDTTGPQTTSEASD